MTISNARPGPIVAVCFVWILLSLQYVYILSQQDITQLAESQILQIVGMMCEFAAIIGIWMMKKWGVYLFIVLFIIKQILFVTHGAWQLGSIFIPLLMIAVSVAHLRKMT